ncbi:MAG: drug/metabolite transporter (DMT)-like permease [Cellvibrionaceae bacterium]|jgi:drug/metabolite transporter (DMT)-like permease
MQYKIVLKIEQSPYALALIGLALTNLFWAGNAVVARLVVDDIPPLTLIFGRWALAFLLLLPFAFPHLKNSMAVIRERWFIIVVLGLMAIATYNSVLYLAAHSTTAINITLISSSLPLIALLASWLMLNAKPRNWQLVGIVASLLGVFIVISRGQFTLLQELMRTGFNRGDLMIFGLVCLWAVYSVMLRKYPVKLHPIAFLTILIAAGLPVLTVFFLIELTMLPPFSLGLSSAPIFIYAAIFPSILAYLFWINGIKIVGPSVSALSCCLMPLFAAILAVPILGESLYWFHYLGGILILIGLYFGSVFKTQLKSN